MARVCAGRIALATLHVHIWKYFEEQRRYTEWLVSMAELEVPQSRVTMEMQAKGKGTNNETRLE